MPVQAADIFGNYLAGKQASKQEGYTNTRNALAEMDLQNAPQAMADQNALRRQQVEGGQMGLDAEKAKIAHAKLSQAIASGNPKAFILQNIPDLARNMQNHGLDINSMDDAAVSEYAQNLVRATAGAAGISPTAQMQTIGDTANPGAGILQRDPATGALKQVVAPQKPDHFAEAEAGRNARSGASIAARPGNMPADQSNVETAAQAIANYQQSPLGSMAMRSPYGQAVMARVMELNSDYQANEFGARSKAYKDFASGKQGTQVASFNRSFAHLDTLGKLSEALGNNDIQGFNKLKNSFASQTGKAAPSNFDAAKKVVADEIVKAIVGAGGGVADREEAARTINSASSPAQLAGVVETYKELIGGQLSSLQQQYEQSTGRKDFSRFLSKPVIDYARDHPLNGEQAPAAPQGGEVRVNSPQEAMALPPGTVFVTPDGRRKVR